jgi:hypothetical protein
MNYHNKKNSNGVATYCVKVLAALVVFVLAACGAGGGSGGNATGLRWISWRAGVRRYYSTHPARARYDGPLDQGFTLNNGPCVSLNWLVFRTWIPALCSPLKGVTPPGQPALTASFGELNHRPRW